MLLSALFVRFRDIPDLGSRLPDHLLLGARDPPRRNRARKARARHGRSHPLHIYTLNPLVTIFQQFRHAMINRATLGAVGIMGSYLALLEPLGIVAASSRSASGTSTGEAPHIAEDL